MKPVLYVFVRTDMESMTPGRVAAQVSHATSLVHEFFNGVCKVGLKDTFQQWKDDGGNFGTTIVLNGGNLETIRDFLDDLKDCELSNLFLTKLVVDPTYPIKDGDVFHLVSVDTCLAVFFDTENENLSTLADCVRNYFDLYTGKEREEMNE